MKKNIVYLMLILSVFANCNRSTEVNVLINGKFLSSNRVIFDDTLDLRKLVVVDTFTNITLKSGQHKLSINGTTENIKIGNSGGILNLDRREYVIFPIKYSTEDIIANAAFSLDIPIIIDSFVVYQKEMAKNQSDLISVLENPNIKDIASKDLVKIEKKQLFINKIWDYGLNENIPDTISISSTSGKMNVAFKRKIISSKAFLIFAKISDLYIVEKIENKKLIMIINNLKDLDKN